MVRWKKRYFVLDVKFLKKEKPYINSLSIQTSIMKKVQNLFGEYGIACIRNGWQFKRCNPETGLLYLRINRSASRMVAAALPLLSEIDKHPATVSCLFTAATLRHANIFVKKYHESHVRTEKATDQKPTSKVLTKENIIAKRKTRVN